MKPVVFESNDGKRFDDVSECAEHELLQNKAFIDKMNEEFKKGHRVDYWCNAGACGCMGCANFDYYDAGFEYEHFKVWNDKYKPSLGFDFNKNIKITIQNWSDKEKFKNFILEKFRYSGDLKIKDFNFDSDVFYISKSIWGGRELGFALMHYRKDIDIYFNYSIENTED